MEIKGVLLSKLGESSGISEKTGQPWKTAEFLFETVGQYPKKAKFEVRDGQYNLIARFEGLIGKLVTVSFEIDAQKAKDKEFWFNKLRAWGILEYKPEQLTAGEYVATQSQQTGQQPAGEAAGTGAGGSFEELKQHDAVAAVAQKFGEFKEHGTNDDDLPFR